METIYIASSYWRGAMNVDELRYFTEKKEATEYIRKFADFRVYKLDKGNPPKLILTPKMLKDQNELFDFDKDEWVKLV